MTDSSIVERLERINAINYGDSDMESARLFSDVFTEIAYNKTSKNYMYFDGKRWVKDEADIIAGSSVKALARALPLYYMKLSLDDRRIDEGLQYSRNWQKLIFREKVLRDARTNRAIDNSMLDADDYILNVGNGVLNLSEGDISFSRHRSELYCSKIANCDYDERAKSPLWIRTLSEIFQGDEGRIKYLQKLFGLCLTGNADIHKLWLFYGCTTRNGKSTICETLKNVLGDYAVSISPESLCCKNKTDNAALSDLAQIAGARLIICSEFKKGALVDTAMLKQLTGGNEIKAKLMRENVFGFHVKGKIISDTNYLPVVIDGTLFTSNRAVVVPFDRHFQEHEQDKSLKKRLTSKENKSGILNWCLEGLKLFYKEGLEQTDTMKEALSMYVADSDKISNFLIDCMEEDANACLAVSEVYKKYTEWCAESHFQAESIRTFMSDLKTKSLWKATGTVIGKTVRNVIKGYRLAEWVKPAEDNLPFN